MDWRRNVSESYEIRKANEHMEKKRQRMADYRYRVGKRRERRNHIRLVDLLVRTGAVSK